MNKITTSVFFYFALATITYGQADTIDNDLVVTGDLSVSNLIKLGNSIRTTDRAELHLHAIGVNSVSEIFFGSNTRTDSNVR